ncbi:hypothetical protein [Extensimonas sp. H3M7-6]|uniref:hypothetical protein n=1 Tax=Extensimonas soli TaxID=3031322 RepID=UPI0023DB181F|nr:hypothetical protein [Extensimonas sp. H3M7-6]MDF1480673.1 hypothetical protein [Extensimonas sp. H3M7-6]
MSRKKIPNIPLSKRLSGFQAPIGGLGLIFWIGAFQAATWAHSESHLMLANVLSGYIMGFGTAFAGWVFVHLWNGKAERFIEPNGLLRWLSIVTVGTIFLFGLAGLAIDLYGDTDGWFNTLFWIGGGVMSLCTGPTIDSADGL